MRGNKINLVYLMGAGRSGTTALATFLGGNSEIQTLGEMHQFFDHLRDEKPCSCGKTLKECPYWSKILARLPKDFLEQPGEIQKLNDKLEYHSSLPKHLSKSHNKRDLEAYTNIQEQLFDVISKSSEATYVLDSAKYIGRNLSLQKSKKISVKSIYVVRDVRGVINSFSKNIQSSRTPLSTIFYYLAVNFVASMVSLFSTKNAVLKIKYEDFMQNPETELKKLAQFLNLDMQSVINRIQNKETFEIGHIIGGNRLKSNNSIRFNFDERWREKQSRLKQVGYYLLAAPVMIRNRYKI